MWPLLRRAGFIWLVLCLLILIPVCVVAEYTTAQTDFAQRLLITACLLIYPILAIWGSWLFIQFQNRNLSERQSKK